MATSDLQKLIRAYSLLAASCDDLRIIAGDVSREWIASEIESDVALREIPTAVFRTVRGQDILAEELYSADNIDPTSIDPAAIDIDSAAPNRRINSNRLPKLEPLIDAAILSGVLLLGVQRYGCKGRGCPEIGNDLIVATIVRDTLHRKHYHSALLPQECCEVTEELIRERFGDTVLAHLQAINRFSELFEKSLQHSDAPATAIPACYANAIAAMEVSRLRLTARAAGDQIFSTLDERKRDELQGKGIKLDGEFPERTFLQTDYRRARAALAMTGVDHATLREPVTSTLMTAIDDALDDPAKVRRLVGRRGKAIHDVHNNLPMMEYFNAAEHPDDIATVHVAALELMRHLDKCRRKAYNTMLAHAFHIAGAIEDSVGDSLQPRLASMALLHDIVEDGSLSVAGYDQSLHKLKLRFGGPLAAMVAELTDSSSHLDGEKKAQITLQWPHIAQPEKQYNVDRFSTMHLRPTDDETPYTLEGIIVKLSDTAVTFEEGIRNPELMAGWWRHSGARIYWAQKMRGAIVHPLIERLELEILDSETATHYHTAEAALAPETLNSLRHLLHNILLWSDRYAVTNLAILADEFGLTDAEHRRLQESFFNRNVSEEQFANDIIEKLLSDARLDAQIAAGVELEKSLVTLYEFSEGKMATRNLSTFMSYRQTALWRDNVREQLRLDIPLEEREADRDSILTLYRQCMADAPKTSASYSLDTVQLK